MKSMEKVMQKWKSYFLIMHQKQKIRSGTGADKKEWRNTEKRKQQQTGMGCFISYVGTGCIWESCCLQQYVRTVIR